MQKRKRIVSIVLTISLVIGMFFTMGPEAYASSQLPEVDGSLLTNELEAIGYATPKARGEDLLVGYSKVVRAGAGAIYAGGTTMAAHEVPRVQISVIVERVKKEGDSWGIVTGWHAEEKNSDRVGSSRRIEVEGDYYYRVTCIHSAGEDMSDSFTDGIYIEKP